MPNIDIQDILLGKANDYLSSDKARIVKRAYVFADKAHTGQKRLSGEPYIVHPVNTAPPHW